MQVKILICFVTAALAFSVHARPLELKCTEVEKVAALVKQSLAPEILQGSQGASFAIKDLGNGNCKLSLENLIRKDLRHLIDKNLPLNGMNCWSTTLLLKGLRPVAIYAHEPEFRWFMNDSSSCRKLEASETPQPGDVGAIRKKTEGGAPEEIHAFIYLHKNLAISKQNYIFDTQIELTHPDYFNKVFATPDTWTDYFRCGKPKDPRSLDSDTALFDKIEALALRVEKDLKNGVVIGQNERLQSDYLSQIDEINRALFNAKPAPVMTYGRLLFESSIWQFSALQEGDRTPTEGNN